MSNQYRRSRADEREARTGMRQSRGAMIAKIVFGLVLVSAGTDFDSDQWDFSFFAFCLVIGGGFIAWGLLPYLEARRRQKARAEAEEAARTAQILNMPLHKFSDNGGVSDEKVEQLAQQYETIPTEVTRSAPAPKQMPASKNGAPRSGIDWNRDGNLDWKDSAIEKEILRQEAAKRGIDNP